MLDGLSLAWAVIEHLHSHIQCRTLASTHYYQLARLADVLPRVDCYHVTAKHSKDGISFTFKVIVSSSFSSGDRRQISLCNINSLSVREVVRIKDIITQHEFR